MPLSQEQDILQTQIGLGLFSFSGVFSQFSAQEAECIVDRFLNRGGIYLETAQAYNNVSLLNSILAQFPRKSYFLSSKCGTIIKNGKETRSGKYEFIINNCNKHL